VVALKPSGFAMESWAGIGAIAGAAAAIIFSFTGFRVFVFKKK
jgi:putative flippase GtrA